MRLGLGLFSKGGQFSPLDVDGLKLWIDSSDESTITDSGGAVSSVSDKSGNGNDATASGTVTTGTRTMNGRNALDFAGGKLVVPYTTDFATTNDMTVLAVFEVDVVGTNPIVAKYGIGGFSWRLDDENAVGLTLNTTDDNATINRVTRSQAPTAGEQRIIGMRYDVSELEREILYDRTPNQRLKAGEIIASTTDVVIGAPTTGGARMNGLITEVLYFNRKLTNAELDRLGSYLRNKWGAPWATEANTLIVATAGQSNMTNGFEVGDNGYDIYNEEFKTAFLAEAANYWSNVELLDNALSATPVLQANAGGATWWVDDDLTDGTQLVIWKNQMDGTNEVNGISAWGDASKVKATLWVGGEGDFGDTESDFEGGLNYLFNEFRDYTRTDHKVLPLIVGRRGVSFDDTYQNIRNGVIDIESSLSFVSRFGEGFDGELADDTHYVAEYQTTLGTRAAKRLAALMGKRSEVGTLGAIITGGTYSGTTVTATFEKDGEFTLSGSEVNQFRIEDDGVAVTINSLSIDNDVNTITFTLSSAIASGSTVQLWCNYGRGANVTLANIVKDSNGLPMRSVKELSITEA